MATRPYFWTDQIGIIGFQFQLIKCPSNFFSKNIKNFNIHYYLKILEEMIVSKLKNSYRKSEETIVNSNILLFFMEQPVYISLVIRSYLFHVEIKV